AVREPGGARDHRRRGCVGRIGDGSGLSPALARRQSERENQNDSPRHGRSPASTASPGATAIPDSAALRPGTRARTDSPARAELRAVPSSVTWTPPRAHVSRTGAPFTTSAGGTAAGQAMTSPAANGPRV